MRPQRSPKIWLTGLMGLVGLVLMITAARVSAPWPFAALGIGMVMAAFWLTRDDAR